MLMEDLQFPPRDVTYKNPTKVLSTDIEADWKAGHCVDPESDMQFCAIATGAAARIDSRAVLVLIPIEGCFRLFAQSRRRPPSVAIV
jgi:hypothetical protein